MTVLRLVSVAVGGLAGGASAADRVLEVATTLAARRSAADDADQEAVSRLRTAFPSQRGRAALLDPYLELARARVSGGGGI